MNLKLKSFSLEDPVTMVYEMADDKITVDMVLTKVTGGNWVAKIDVNDGPADDTPDGAAKKLGEIFFRLEELIKEYDGKFGTIDVLKVLT